MKKLGFLGASLLTLFVISASFGSVPPAGRTTSDTAIYQNMSEITVPRQGKISFDSDLQRLNQMEPRFHERLPKLADRPELSGPIHRISTTKYQPVSHRQKAGRAAIRKPVIEAVDPESPAAQSSHTSPLSRH